MISERDTIFIIVIALLILSYAIVFLLGLIIGKLWSNRGVSNNRTITNRNSKNTEISTDNKITIDNSKFVTDIKTDGMEKKYSTIGETKNSSENISDSITKLKNLKR